MLLKIGKAGTDEGPEGQACEYRERTPGSTGPVRPTDSAENSMLISTVFSHQPMPNYQLTALGSGGF